MPKLPEKMVPCKRCGHKFVWQKVMSNRSYCSRKCRDEYYASLLKGPFKIHCDSCRKEFTSNRKAKYCSNECRKSGYQKQYKTTYQKTTFPEIECAICKSVFQPKQSTHKLCSDQCRVASTLNAIERQRVRRKNEVIQSKRQWGRYVYGWYFPGEIYPFYVGQGHGDRAWDKHEIDGKDKAFCERIRTSTTKVVIYRNNLTLEGALLVESVIINLFRELGVVLANQSEPMKRKEVPPLEISD